MNFLSDAQLLATMHPETFDAPTQSEIETLIPGDLVKVCRNGERFWVILTDVETGLGLPMESRCSGTVDNELVFDENDDLKLGQSVEFQARHVYQIWRDENRAS